MTDVLGMLGFLAGGAGLAFGLVQRHRAQEQLAGLRSRFDAAVQELARVKEHSRRELDGMGAALWEWNLTDDSITLSDLFLEITGYDRTEFGPGADRFFLAFHPDERGEARQALQDYLDRKTAHCTNDVRFRCKDGHYLWMHLRAVGSWDRDGRALGLVGSFSDISSRMEAEEERDRLFNLSTDMLSVGGFDQQLQQINPAWVRVLGWSRDEFMGRPLTQFIHPDDLQVTGEAWELLRAGTPVEGLENRYRCRDGSYRWLSWGSFPYPDRKLVFSVGRDITAQKESELQLLEYQARLRSLSNQLSLVEDRQRRELANAIHDGLAQQLFGIRAQMVLLKYPDRVPDLQQVVQGIIAILDDTMADARNLSFELFPPVLYEVGLEAALTWLCSTHSERMGIPCRLQSEGVNEELPEELRSMAYQCVRELLVNVNKHAQATSADMALNFVDRFLTIVVEDDGVGFDVASLERAPGQVDAARGFGLFSIRERLRSIEGRLLVDSLPGQGTRVFLSIPFPTSDPSPSVDHTFLATEQDRLHG